MLVLLKAEFQLFTFSNCQKIKNFVFHKNENQPYVKENACLYLSYSTYHFHPCIRVTCVVKNLAPSTSVLFLSRF